MPLGGWKEKNEVFSYDARVSTSCDSLETTGSEGKIHTYVSQKLITGRSKNEAKIGKIKLNTEPQRAIKRPQQRQVSGWILLILHVQRALIKSLPVVYSLKQ